MKRFVLLGAALALSAACGPKTFPLTDPGIVAAKEDAELVARGEYLFHGPAGCSGCHSTVEVGLAMKAGDKPTPSGGHVWKMGPLGTLYSPNITADEKTGVGKWSDQDLARMIKHGQRPDGTAGTFMVFAVGLIADEDVRALVSYMRTLPPVAHEVPRHEIGLLGALVLGGIEPKANDVKTAPPLGATVERGQYLAWGPADCRGCHSEADGFAVKAGREFVGADQPMESELEGDANTYLPPNLRPDPSGITGKWTEEQFLARFKEGRVHKGSPMPWGSYQNMQEDDVKALWLYFKSLAPVKKDYPLTVIPKK